MAAIIGILALLMAAATAAPGSVRERLQKVDAALIQAEMEAWSAGGHPHSLRLPSDNGTLVEATVITSPSTVGDLLRHELKANADNIKFHVYTRSNNYSSVEGTQVTFNVSDFQGAGWDPALPTKVVIHGFSNTIASPIIQLIKDAYMNTSTDYNVLGVDWGKLCPMPLYVTARLNVPTAGEYVGQLLQFLSENQLIADRGRLHLIGHSLGAHVAGLAAKTLAELTGAKPHRVTGLDPAWPLFMITPEAYRLNADDADIVDVIHTCGGFLGFSSPIGKTDFYPNGGSSQPGCGLDLDGVCAHSRSYEYFAESISEGKGYQADFCQSNTDARNGACNTDPSGCMGDKVEYKEEGSYYLQTNEVEPIQEC